MARNLKLTIAYDGSEFHGWQIQPDRPTVQGILSEVIGRTTGEKVLPQGSGRTDTGVHARAQVTSFTTDSTIPLVNFRKVLNDRLPPAIRILSVEEVPSEFHARHSAIAKTYEYRVYCAEIVPPWLARYVAHHPWPLDRASVFAAAAFVLGEHDFTSFAAVDPDRGTRSEEDDDEYALDAGTRLAPKHATNIRTITESSWHHDGDEIAYTVRGNGFLHHMVRNLVGTMLVIGKGTWQPEDMKRILDARDRSAAGPTAPANGLWLMSVEY
ncbi:MAG TPA: tRNA pseudouridine synthase A [Terriglobales bacterium]|nr:tRNA pseudouridine synthase A [Terriglobales bacterium]